MKVEKNARFKSAFQKRVSNYWFVYCNWIKAIMKVEKNARFKSAFQKRVSKARFKSAFLNLEKRVSFVNALLKRDFETRVWVFYLKKSKARLKSDFNAFETRFSKRAFQKRVSHETRFCQKRKIASAPQSILKIDPERCYRSHRVWKAILKIAKREKSAFDKKSAFTQNANARFALLARLKRDKRDKSAFQTR